MDSNVRVIVLATAAAVVVVSILVANSVVVAATVVVAAVVVVSAAIAVTSFRLRCCWHYSSSSCFRSYSCCHSYYRTAAPVYIAVRTATIVVVIIQPRATNPGENHSGGETLQGEWRKKTVRLRRRGKY